MTESKLELTQNEKALYCAFKAVQRTHEEVATLFRSLDRALEENGYVQDGKDGQFPLAFSKRYEDAKKFCPCWFYQDYLYANNRKICFHVSVCPFGDEDENPPFDQLPIISCELYIYLKPIKKGEASDADIGDEEGYAGNQITPNGIFRKKEYTSEKGSLRTLQEYMIRMLALRTPQDIQRMIIEPLTMMAEQRPADEIIKKLEEFKDALVPLPVE